MSKRTALTIAWLVGVATGFAACVLIALLAMWLNVPTLAAMGGVVCGIGAYVAGLTTYDKLYKGW